MEWLVGPVDESSDRLYEFDRRDGLAEPAVYVIAAQFPRNAIASSFRRWVHGVVMPAVRAKTTLP